MSTQLHTTLNPETATHPDCPSKAATCTLVSRFWEYQKERFPIFAHGVLIASFSFCGVALSASLRHWDPAPGAPAFLTAFLTSFLFFLQLRISDEHKDRFEDARFRPYRPVPRGLISLDELAKIGAWSGLIQLAVVLAFYPGLLIPLLAVWLYLFLMTKEFFVGNWLKKHPVLYAASHMLIIPLIDFFTTACDWLPASGLHNFAPQPGLIGFLIVSYFNGIVIEIGRKIRYKGQEEPGVETYSSLWGPITASRIWFYALVVTAFAGILTAASTGNALVEVVILLVLSVGAGALTLAFDRSASSQINGTNEPCSVDSKLFEKYSALWTIAIYLSLGGLPLLQHIARSALLLIAE